MELFNLLQFSAYADSGDLSKKNSPEVICCKKPAALKATGKDAIPVAYDLRQESGDNKAAKKGEANLPRDAKEMDKKAKKAKKAKEGSKGSNTSRPDKKSSTELICCR